MARFISRRLLLSLITLWLLATIVFVIANVLPNDVARTILGPFAPQESVDALNEQLGTNRPLIVQYIDSMVGVFTLDFGTLPPRRGKTIKLLVLAQEYIGPISMRIYR